MIRPQAAVRRGSQRVGVRDLRMRLEGSSLRGGGGDVSGLVVLGLGWDVGRGGA